MAQLTPRDLVKMASEQTENSFVKEWLRSDEKGVFEEMAQKFLAHDAFCTHPKEALQQAVDHIRFAALSAALNGLKGT